MNIHDLAKRARLQRITDRATELDHLRDMLDGTYQPANGRITPPFKAGTSRAAAYDRALRITNTTVPLIINKSAAALDFGSITWSDAVTGAPRADDALADLPLARIARELAIELELAGACAAMASTPLDPDGRTMPPTVEVLHGVNIPYADPIAPARVSGWYRAIQYLDDSHGGALRWWVEAYDFTTTPTTHRVWRTLGDPTALGFAPDDEYRSLARPRYHVLGVSPDGLPVSPLLQNLGRVMGLYATELRLATTEELSAYPMLLTRGEADVTQIGPGEVIAVDAEGDARWLDPGSLQELREQMDVKRDQVREAFSLPGGSLGGQTPSGEALAEANRSFLQKSRMVADALSKLLSEVVSDYLALLNLPPVTVSVPIDRAYTTQQLLEVVEKGVDLQVIPQRVAARVFQQFVGEHYSDEELERFLEEMEERQASPPAGFLSPRDEPVPGEDDAGGDEALA